MDPDNFIDLTQLAILYFFEYEDDLCLELLRSALVINNSYLPALVTAAELMFLTGHYSDAKFFYQKANLPEKVAKACYREGSLIEAAKYLDRFESTWELEVYQAQAEYKEVYDSC
jgi:hypothetical protein